MNTLERILVPVDFSACSRAALDFAALVANRFGASIDVLHIWAAPTMTWAPFYPPGSFQDRLALFERSEAGRSMKDFLAHLEGELGLRVRGRLATGDPCSAILDVAAEDSYDLIVMGTHGRTGMSHLLLGSIAEAVVRKSPCPVVTIHAATQPGRAQKAGHHPAVGDAEGALS